MGRLRHRKSRAVRQAREPNSWVVSFTSDYTFLCFMALARVGIWPVLPLRESQALEMWFVRAP